MFQAIDSSPKSLYDLDPNNDRTMFQNKAPEISNSVDSFFTSIKRGLRSNSLSIVNPIDVLRNHVILELARRKAVHDQRQAVENRRILENIGKRSIHRPEDDFPRNLPRSLENNEKNRLYTNPRSNPPQHEQHQQIYTQRIPIARTHDWYDVDDSLIRENGDDEARKVIFHFLIIFTPN